MYWRYSGYVVWYKASTAKYKLKLISKNDDHRNILSNYVYNIFLA